MKITVYRLQPGSDADKVWDALEGLGYPLLYSERDGDVHTLYGEAVPEKLRKKILAALPEVEAASEGVLPEIDWDAQWKEHGMGYREGCLEIDLSCFLPELPDDLPFPRFKLLPGPGFGDLSHPTTRLVLSLMADQVRGRNVLDIGCGSGILSLAALGMGAEAAYGLDIDVEAVEHSQRNAGINGLGHAAHFMLPDQASSLIPDGSYVALMNMIQSEQVVAWNSLARWHPAVCIAVTSGILSEGRDSYVAQCREWGWRLVGEKEEDGWVGFVFRL